MGIPAPSPARLSVFEPKVLTLTPTTLVWRIYRAAGENPGRWNAFRHFGPLASRFDHHLEDVDGRPRSQARGILYAAPDLVTCVAEFFQAGRHVDRSDGEPRVVAFHPAAPLDLLDLTGRFATQAGCHQGIHSSPLRRRTRAWSRAFYEVYPQIQGLLYRSKMAVDLPAYVFYERALDALPAVPFVDLPLTDLRLANPLAAAARELGYGIG